LVFCCTQKQDRTETTRTYQDKPLPIQSPLLAQCFAKGGAKLTLPTSTVLGQKRMGVFSRPQATGLELCHCTKATDFFNQKAKLLFPLGDGDMGMPEPCVVIFQCNSNTVNGKRRRTRNPIHQHKCVMGIAELHTKHPPLLCCVADDNHNSLDSSSNQHLIFTSTLRLGYNICQYQVNVCLLPGVPKRLLSLMRR